MGLRSSGSAPPVGREAKPIGARRPGYGSLDWDGLTRACRPHITLAGESAQERDDAYPAPHAPEYTGGSSPGPESRPEGRVRATIQPARYLAALERLLRAAGPRQGRRGALLSRGSSRQPTPWVRDLNRRHLSRGSGSHGRRFLILKILRCSTRPRPRMWTRVRGLSFAGPLGGLAKARPGIAAGMRHAVSATGTTAYGSWLK